MRARLRAPLAVTAALLALGGLLSGPAGAADPGRDESQPVRVLAGAVGQGREDSPPAWRQLLAGATEAARTTAYRGEALWVTWTDGVPHVVASHVVGSPRGEVTVRADERYTVRIGDDGGGLTDHQQGWFLQLPAVDLAGAGYDLDRLEDKYRVEVAGTEALHDRDCTRLDVRRRVDDRLRERLWLDDASGLLLRRETFDGEERLLRMATYLSLDLGPAAGPRDPGAVSRGVPAGGESGRPGRLEQRRQGVWPVGPRALQALREAGWLVPQELTGGYGAIGVWAVSAQDSQPLQIAYGDGLYSVSLFQQRGHPDWESLPPGAEQVDGLDWAVYHWPGAVPQRLVWEASGTTYSLVGDAPADELRAIAAALPHRRDPGLVERLRRGLSRLWSWASPTG